MYVPVCEYMCACVCVPNSFQIKFRDTEVRENMGYFRNHMKFSTSWEKR